MFCGQYASKFYYKVASSVRQEIILIFSEFKNVTRVFQTHPFFYFLACTACWNWRIPTKTYRYSWTFTRLAIILTSTTQSNFNFLHYFRALQQDHYFVTVYTYLNIDWRKCDKGIEHVTHAHINWIIDLY